MSEKTYTEREVVLRERMAYLAGREDEWSECLSDMWRNGGRKHRVASRNGAAPLCYPLPKVTRSRVVKDPEENFTQLWRCVGGRLEHSPHGDNRTHWFNISSVGNGCLGDTCWLPTPARIKMWADLLANPTEEVEADE